MAYGKYKDLIKRIESDKFLKMLVTQNMMDMKED